MDIKTKLDIGDTPFCLHNNFPVKIKITKIEVVIREKVNSPYIVYTGELMDSYDIDVNSTHIQVSEKYVYSSVEEMKEQLFKDIGL